MTSMVSFIYKYLVFLWKIEEYFREKYVFLQTAKILKLKMYHDDYCFEIVVAKSGS